MKCSLTGQNTRILAKAVLSFSRIGSELYLEANQSGLLLRTVNDSKTAFAVINFETGFFTDFRIGRSSADEYCNKCKISMKSCLGAFKNLRQVQTCQIILNSRTSKLLFQFTCLFDTFKTLNVSILEQETLNAVYMTKNVPNKLTAPNKLFTEIIGNFRMYDNEITIEAATDSVVLKNHVDMHTDKHLMRTKLALKPDEFQEYSITEATTITFCLKELRAILNFADALSLDMTVNFESAGKAVVFAFGSQDNFTANLVMSTLAPDETSDSQNLNLETTRIPWKTKDNRFEISSHALSTKPIEVIDLEDDNDVSFVGSVSNMHRNPPSINDNQKEIVSSAPSHSPLRPLTAPINSAQKSFPKDPESEEIRVIFRDESDTGTGNDDEEMEIPASPQPDKRRRLRRIFPRCFQNTQYAENLPGKVLAEMTDDEM